jgi:uncharacterized membrane protein
MADTQPAWNDERTDQIIGQLLRVGLILSVAVVAVGAILYLIHYGGGRADYASFRGEPADLRSITGIVHGAMRMCSRYIIQLGLILLIASPVMRVAFSVFAFAAQRDWIYFAVTLLVLVILLSSLAGRV